MYLRLSPTRLSARALGNCDLNGQSAFKVFTCNHGIVQTSLAYHSFAGTWSQMTHPTIPRTSFRNLRHGLTGADLGYATSVESGSPFVVRASNFVCNFADSSTVLRRSLESDVSAATWDICDKNHGFFVRRGEKERILHSSIDCRGLSARRRQCAELSTF